MVTMFYGSTGFISVA